MGNLYFRFMVVEYCAGTLDDLVHGRCEGPADSLQQISSGLAFLHSLNIVHSNLKPSNILASLPTGNNPPMMKLADFGLCHINKNWNQTLFGNKERAAYTSEWGPPESILSPAFDVYSLARVFCCFVLLKHSYPTKISLIEFIALVTNARRLNPFIFRCSFQAMLQLIDTMLSFKAYRRPTATQVLQQIASPYKYIFISLRHINSEKVKRVAIMAVEYGTISRTSSNADDSAFLYKRFFKTR